MTATKLVGTQGHRNDPKQLEDKLNVAKLRNDEDTRTSRKWRQELRAVADASKWMKEQLS